MNQGSPAKLVADPGSFVIGRPKCPKKTTNAAYPRSLSSRRAPTPNGRKSTLIDAVDLQKDPALSFDAYKRSPRQICALALGDLPRDFGTDEGTAMAVVAACSAVSFLSSMGVCDSLIRIIFVAQEPLLDSKTWRRSGLPSTDPVDSST